MRYLYVILFCVISFTAMSQAGLQVFNDYILHEVRITINAEHWFDTLSVDYMNHRNDPDHVPEISRPCLFEFDGVKLDTIGIRERGNASVFLNSVKFKKPYKLEFDAFKNLKLDELKNLNLNNFTDDPSFVREAMCYKFIRDLGLLAPRTSYAKVYINEQYWGLYMLVESVDKTFLKDHFGSKGKDGNLYKPAQTGQAYLNTIDINDTLYKEKSGLELKTNNATDDWSRLIHFIDIINHPDMVGFKDSLLKLFDVNAYLMRLAIEELVDSWDSYWANGNNYYLYEHPGGSIIWISWDMNETFPNKHGLDLNRLAGAQYLLPTNHYDGRPLIKAIFSVEEWKNKYYDIVCNMLNNQFRVQYMDTTLLRWHQLINEAVYNDTNKFYPYESFDGSLTADLVSTDFTFPRSGIRIGRNLPGIIPFVQQQRDWARKQIELLGYSCDFAETSNRKYKLSLFPNPSSQNTLNITWDSLTEGLARIQLINAEGKLVVDIYNQKAIDNKLQADIITIPAGIYWVLKLDADGSVGCGKWVKF